MSQVHEDLGLPWAVIGRWISTGALPFYKDDLDRRKKLVDMRDVQALLAERIAPATIPTVDADVAA